MNRFMIYYTSPKSDVPQKGSYQRERQFKEHIAQW